MECRSSRTLADSEAPRLTSQRVSGKYNGLANSCGKALSVLPASASDKLFDATKAIQNQCNVEQSTSSAELEQPATEWHAACYPSQIRQWPGRGLHRACSGTSIDSAAICVRRQAATCGLEHLDHR